MNSSTLSFVLGLFLLVAGQGNDVKPSSVEGIAKNLKTGEVLADVRVTLTPEFNPAAAGKTATTDADGKFTITGIAPGRYSVAAARTLFFRPRRNTGTVAVTLAADQKLNNVQVLMMPTAVIAGRVIDDNREPLRSVRIEALRAEYRDGARSFVMSAQNTTDDRGEYRLFNLQPGTYYIRATPPATGASSPALYYPGVADSQDASAIQIEAGGEVGAIDIALRRINEYSVKFKVGGVPTGAVVSVTVQKRNSRVVETALGRAEAQPDNTYTIQRLAPGAYDLFVQIATTTTGIARFTTNASKIPVNIGRANEDLGTIAVRPTVPVTGRLVAPEALPTPIDLKKVQVTFRPLDMPANVGATVRGSTTPPGFNDDGSFTIPNVVAARFQVFVSGLPADTYLVSAKTGGREVLDTGYTVSGDQSPIELVIGGPNSVGVVEGTVVNTRGEPMPGSTVALVPAVERRGNAGAYRVTTADQQGNFQMRSVLAGDYKVFAWEDIEPGAYVDPEVLKEFEARGEALRVGKGSQNTVSVRIIPAP